MPKCFRGEKEEKIKEILNNPIRDDYMKRRFIKRYEKSIETHKNWQKPGFPPYSNLETFFYIYKIIWFNSRNCNFDKGDLYELKVSKKITSKLNKKIEAGKDYFEWQFSDFRERKLDKLTPEKRIKKEEAKRLRELKKQQELENKNE